jgi:hypothetical protein
MTTLTSVRARVIAGAAAKQLGKAWEYDAPKTERVSPGNGKAIALYEPKVWHRSNLIGLHFVPSSGWICAIGLRSGLTEGEKHADSQCLIKVYSDANVSPRRAVIECIDRLRRIVQGLQQQFSQLDQIIRETARAEDPETAPADPLTFDQWWAANGGAADRVIAERAWAASKEGV